jgi:hypothetical protein
LRGDTTNPILYQEEGEACLERLVIVVAAYFKYCQTEHATRVFNVLN